MRGSGRNARPTGRGANVQHRTSNVEHRTWEAGKGLSALPWRGWSGRNARPTGRGANFEHRTSNVGGGQGTARPTLEERVRQECLTYLLDSPIPIPACILVNSWFLNAEPAGRPLSFLSIRLHLWFLPSPFPSHSCLFVCIRGSCGCGDGDGSFSGSAAILEPLAALNRVTV